MTLTSIRSRRVLGGVAALAVAASVLPFGGVAEALPPGTPAAGSATLTPSSGTSATTFSIAPPVGAVCPGDNTAGYLYHTFITPFGNDPADFVWSPSGTPTGEPAFTNNLANSIGTRSRNIAPGLGDGLVIPVNSQTFSNALFAGLTPGAYTVGISCTQPDAGSIVQTMRFWSTNVTVTASAGAGPNNFTFQTGVAPAAPTLNSASAGNQECVVAFTPGAGGATSFTATANPGGITATGAASPLTITGLTNGTAYTITVTGTNAVGTSPASNSLSCTPVAGPRTNVTGLTATPGAPGSGIVNLAWTAPGPNTPAASPVSYDVTWTGPTPGSASVPFGTNSYSATGLGTGNYAFSVVAVYADSPTAGTPVATASATVSPSSVIIQDIDTVRPVGALVLTQVCNANGAIPAQVTQFGFPSGIPAVSALNSSTVANPSTTGTAPTTTSGGATADPNFPEYPYPVDDTLFTANPTYPTYCGIDLGRARFVTRGAAAGQFFAAVGQIDQITVVDTRDDDTGWAVTGTMSQFSANGGTDTFSGSQLGWTPQVTEDSPAFTDSLGNSYNQTAAAGADVAPNSPAATGLSSGRTLMSAAAGQGLGVAIADARLKLLIPVTADAGAYTGTLTFSAA